MLSCDRLLRSSVDPLLIRSAFSVPIAASSTCAAARLARRRHLSAAGSTGTSSLRSYRRITLLCRCLTTIAIRLGYEPSRAAGVSIWAGAVREGRKR